MIASALGGVPVWGGQQGVHFIFFEIGHGRLGAFFEGNAANFATPRNVIGTVHTDKVGKGMNGRQSLVACCGCAMSRLFEVVEEETKVVCGEMLDGQSIDWVPKLLRQKRQKQGQAIAVTVLCILLEIPISKQVFEQEPSDPGTEKRIVSHDISPLVEHIVRIARSPGTVSLRSWLNSAALPRCEHGRGMWTVAGEVAARRHVRDTKPQAGELRSYAADHEGVVGSESHHADGYSLGREDDRRFSPQVIVLPAGHDA
jgi:hypothetical protein